MKDTQKRKTTSSDRTLWFLGIACIACCAVPLAGIFLGSAAIAGLAFYSEKAAVFLLAVGVAVLLLKLLRHRSAPACKLNGSCASEKADTET